jgi:Asp-tRNA(Asn)/Glu-tRNA(Gln) amidotransferase A subunit family amidase
MLGLCETARSLRDGTLDVMRLLATIEDRMQAREPDVLAMLPEPDRFARLAREAQELCARYPDVGARPPLFCVPVAVKDIIHVQGFPTRAGSSLPPEALSGQEGPVVAGLRAAGALVLGKSHTTEFAYFNPSPTRNPRNPAHTPGGSSSGSAAAVAAGYCPLGIGTQTVGSVIRPASYCGVTGFKPTLGRMSMQGIIPFSRSVDQAGFFTSDVAGAELAGSVLCSGWRGHAPGRVPGVLAVPEGPLLERVEPDALRAFREAADGLRARGFGIVEARVLDDLESVRELHEALTASDMAAAHAAWHPRFADLYGERTRRLIERGRDVPAAQVAAAHASMASLRARLDGYLRERRLDGFLCPSAPGTAPLGLSSTGDPIMNLPWTHAGLPVVSLPSAGLHGLPLGLQVAGRFGGDEELLGLCARLAESVTYL